MFFALFIVSLVVVGHRGIFSSHNIHTDFFIRKYFGQTSSPFVNIIGEPISILIFPYLHKRFHTFWRAYDKLLVLWWLFLPFVGPSVILDNIQVPSLWNVYSFILFIECIALSLLEFFAIGDFIHQHHLNPFLYNVSLLLILYFLWLYKGGYINKWFLKIYC